MNDQESRNVLEFFATTLVALDNLDYSKDEFKFTGYVPLDFEFSYDELEAICQSLNLDTSDSDRGQRKIVFDIVNTGIFYSLDDYLSNPERRVDVKPKSSFYIFEEKLHYISDYNYKDEELPNFIKIAKLYDALNTISDFQGYLGNEPYIIFFGKINLKLNFKFKASDLNVNFKKIMLFVDDYVFNKMHHEDRVLSIRNALNEMFLEKDVEFSIFLKKFEAFYLLVRNNFQLYIDNFSFDDFKNKLEEDRREYTIKINKVFSDMQNQLLTLPLATVLAAGQIVLVNGFGDFVKNSLIVVGISIFCNFVLMKISNKNSTLTALRNEINLREEEMIKKDDSTYRAEYLEVYAQLSSRLNKLDSNLKLVKKITIFATVLVFLVYFTRLFY
ncbi:hypothetical protein [Acinetobacter proteolyticus]|uniref:Phage-related membrane protein n=1 Tax=Acinetobacter proteolyticus TaxID=1776741 RepID=A0A2N0WIT1_9GAMM|nr:hypothetical protein [Acinetobacter proteolyticus]PKF36064.1 hypothetical protein CW311_02505 [Acinetobacter proteolyticus]